jgi:hypothetical protein
MRLRFNSVHISSNWKPKHIHQSMHAFHSLARFKSSRCKARRTNKVEALDFEPDSRVCVCLERVFRKVVEPRKYARCEIGRWARMHFTVGANWIQVSDGFILLYKFIQLSRLEPPKPLTRKIKRMHGRAETLLSSGTICVSIFSMPSDPLIRLADCMTASSLLLCIRIVWWWCGWATSQVH